MNKEVRRHDIIALSPRQLQTLRLAVEGKKNAEIAAELGIAVHTVEKMLSNENHSRSIFRRIGVTNRAQAIGWYVNQTDPLRIPSAEENDSLAEMVVAHPLFVELIEERLQDIVLTRRAGYPHLTLLRAKAAATQLQRYTAHAPSRKAYRHLMHLYGLIRYEQHWAVKETAYIQEVEGLVRPIVREIERVAKECADRFFYGLYCLAQGDTYYLLGRPEVAIRWLSNALDAPLDSENRIASLRALALCYAQQASQERFTEIMLSSERISEDSASAPQHVCELYEGLARSQGMLDEEMSFRTLERGQAIYRSFAQMQGREPFREVQFIRSHLELLQWFTPNEQRTIEQQGSEGLRLAQEYGYKRHETHIHTILTAL